MELQCKFGTATTEHATLHSVNTQLGYITLAQFIKVFQYNGTGKDPPATFAILMESMQQSKGTKHLDMFLESYTSNLISIGFERIFTSFAVPTEKYVHPCLCSQELLHQVHAAFQDFLQGNLN